MALAYQDMFDHLSKKGLPSDQIQAFLESKGIKRPKESGVWDENEMLWKKRELEEVEGDIAELERHPFSIHRDSPPEGVAPIGEYGLKGRVSARIQPGKEWADNRTIYGVQGPEPTYATSPQMTEAYKHLLGRKKALTEDLTKQFEYETALRFPKIYEERRKTTEERAYKSDVKTEERGYKERQEQEKILREETTPKPTEAERFTDELGNEWKQRMVFKGGKYEPTGERRLVKPNMTVQQAEKKILDIKKNIFDASKATSQDAMTAIISTLNPDLAAKMQEGKGPDFETLRKDYINEANLYIRELQRFVNNQKGITTKSPNVERKVLRRGKEKGTGRKVVQYDDGTVEYATD